MRISDVKLYLTQVQYRLLILFATKIPLVFEGPSDNEEETGAPGALTSQRVVTSNLHVDLEPELRSSLNNVWTSLDLVVSVNAVKLHLYDASAFCEDDLKDHGIARFALNDNTLRFKLLSSGAGEAQLVLRSFTMGNTQPGQTKYREMIPAAQHDRNQFMLLYSMAGGQGSSLAVLTVDSPQIIFAVDPVISLLEFFTDTEDASTTDTDMAAFAGVKGPDAVAAPQVQAQNQGTVDFRLDLHDVSVSVLENDVDSESRALRLYVSQISISQQVCLNSCISDQSHLNVTSRGLWL